MEADKINFPVWNWQHFSRELATEIVEVDIPVVLQTMLVFLSTPTKVEEIF